MRPYSSYNLAIFYTHSPLLINSQKTAKSAIPISQTIHCSPHLADPYAPRIPIRAMLPYVSTVPTYNHQDPKNPTPIPRDQRFRPRKPGADPVSTNSLRRLPARYRMSGRSINRRDQRSVHSNLRTQPVHADSPRLRAARRWRRGTASGHGVASRRGDGVAVGPCVQARLKTGSCGADPRGTGTGWTRQKSADAAPDPQNE